MAASSAKQSCGNNNGGCQNGSQCVLNWQGLIWCKNCPAGCSGYRCEQGRPYSAPAADAAAPAAPVAAAPVAEPLPAPAAIAPVTQNAAPAAAATGSAVSASDVASIVGKHNECRANVSPPAAKPISPMVWDAGVAASAQAYADTCPEGHAPPDQVS
jgi:Cysteine-rich secretory protein family